MRWVAVLAVASAVALCGCHVLSADDQGELWAVLVAGSATWMNYRHQVGLRSVFNRVVDENTSILPSSEVDLFVLCI